MEATLVGDLRAVTNRVFKYHPEGLKLYVFLVHKHSNVKKSRPYILSLRDREGFLRILETLSLIFPHSRGQFLEY